MIANLNIAAKSFAHLLHGRGVSESAKKADKDEDEKEKMEEKDEKKEKECEDKKPPANDDEDGKKGKKAESEEKEEKDKAEKEDDKDGDDEEEKPKEKSKKKASAEGFDPATLARCESIFASEHATGRPDMACELAFNTQLSAEAAIAVMKISGPVAKPSRLADKMQTVKNPDVGASDVKGGNGSGDPASTLAASINAAYKKANNEA